MCGKGMHWIEIDEDGDKTCWIDYLCNANLCREEPERCPHRGVGECICTEDDGYYVDYTEDDYED